MHSFVLYADIKAVKALQQNAKKMAVLIPSNDISAVATCYHFWRRPTGTVDPPLMGDKLSVSCIQTRSEEHTSELQSHSDLVCRLLLEKKKNTKRPPREINPSSRHLLVRRNPS